MVYCKVTAIGLMIRAVFRLGVPFSGASVYCVVAKKQGGSDHEKNWNTGLGGHPNHGLQRHEAEYGRNLAALKGN